MTEEFLHYIWKFRLFTASQLILEEGEAIEVLHPGEYNTHSGPDFFNARIRIGSTQWVGNVEIHVRSSDWKRHGHSEDKAYDQVILHVVYIHDMPLFRKTGEPYPTLQLLELIPKHMENNYITLRESKERVPCEKRLCEIDPFLIHNYLDRLAAERLERKTNSIPETLASTKNNWEETLYRQIANAFGFKINAVPFELLSKSVPFALLLKHRHSSLQTEALLFGQAGFLDESLRDGYPRQLQNEYVFLQKKFGLVPNQKHVWKHMRMHPSNFPSIRISQFASLFNRNDHLFSEVMEAKSPEELASLMEVQSHSYWDTHYYFDKESPFQQKRLGKGSRESIILNAIIPFYFAYGTINNKETYMELALEMLEKIRPESNSIIDQWRKAGIRAENASQTQALLELKNEYCLRKKCLQCAIGNKLLNKKVEIHNHSLNLQV
jgi:hypothetical protein